ncbi:MAG: hypothetical protein H8E66_15280 [Planctomycetes bacterium]|nr:hypothetical protein [Planctomycetota bacterium]
MAKIKFDKESLQGFFFNHTEKIVLAVVLLLLGLFIWSGSSLEGIGAQNPAELASKVDAVAKKIELPTFDNIKQDYTPIQDHVSRKEIGDAATSESYYPLDIPLGGVPNSVEPRQDPELFRVMDVEAVVLTGALAFKTQEGLPDPFADLENMEQKKIEAPKPKKKKKKKKKGGGSMYSGGASMEEMYGEEEDEEDEAEGMYGSGSNMASIYGAEGGGGAAPGAAVSADADKFHGYRPNATSTVNGSSVVGRAFHVVAVKALVPYQQQWDEFERVFADAAGYLPSRDIPRYFSFRAQRAEVPSDPNAPLVWRQKPIATTQQQLDVAMRGGFAGFPGELADSKYLLPGVLTMPVPPMMFRDLRPLFLHSKVSLQQEAKSKVIEQTAPEVVNIDDIDSTTETNSLPPGAGAGAKGVSGMYGPGGGEGMYGPGGGEGMYGPGGGEGMYSSGGGEGMYGPGGGGMYSSGGGASAQLVRGPEAEFLMVRFFDFSVKPGKKYVYRIQVEIEDPNHPRSLQMQPQDQILADTVRTRLTKVAGEESKQAAALKTPIRLFTVTSDWSDASSPVSVDLASNETYAGGVNLPRMLDVAYSSGPNVGQKSGYAVPADRESSAEVMSLTWNSTYAVDLPGIITANRGTLLSQTIDANLINPVTMVFKTIPEYVLSSGELVVDLRGGEILEAAKEAGGQPLLTPGEIAVIDASGNFIIRNELDDWQTFEKYAPPPAVVVEAASSMSEGGEEMDYGDMESIYGEGE